jgi:Geranylgeranyl pyrophosphate synthase
MTTREKIEAPVSVEFKEFCEGFATSLYSGTAKLQNAIDHLQKASGKHIRPLLLLLTAKACGNVTSNTINTAVLVELLHSATLVHDDVIDETKQRRGVPSLNAIFDNRVSVLVGDYLLASALIRSTLTGNLDIISIVSRLGRDLAEGEIKQMEAAEEIIIDEERYLQVIKMKTASLLSACTEIGAISAGANEKTITICRDFGTFLGYSFQIKDDIFDYYKSTNIGKPTGNDIREGKVTMPLLYALNNAGKDEVDRMRAIILNKDFTQENIDILIEFAKANNGIEYAKERMRYYYDKAIDLLMLLPESDSRGSLLLLADYIIDRNK